MRRAARTSSARARLAAFESAGRLTIVQGNYADAASLPGVLFLATVQNEAQAPYGGMKNSGYGRFDGRAVINEFTELKWITVEPSDQQPA